MFKSNVEVNKHVENSLKKINNETERKLRCFSFAKLYFNVGDYEQACRYVSSYLNVKPKSAEGHNLLGKALEKLGKYEAALEAYKTSLLIDSKQNSLVIKVCELLASDNVEIDKNSAKFYCEQAQQLDPHNPFVFALREKLISIENKNPSEISQLFLNELENRPTDVNLRVKLIKHLLQNKMIKEAYKHAYDIEEKNLTVFHNNISWYEVFAEVLVKYQRDLSFSNQINWEFWFLSVRVLDRLVTLSLDENIDSNLKVTTNYVDSTFNFDQTLTTALNNINSCPDKNLVDTFLKHYQGQLFFHFATLLLKQSKKDLVPFKEATNMTLPLFFMSYYSTPPDIQSIWYNNLSENNRKLVNYWHKEASYRCSQTGHILNTLSKERKSILLEKASQYSTGMWREQLFKKLFVKREQQLKMATSFFVSNSQNCEVMVRLPEYPEIIKYDEVAQFVYPDSLHHHIWICMNCNKMEDYVLKCFEGLQYCVKNLNNCAAESLNILDIQAFVYLATLCAQNKVEENKNLIYYNQNKPSVLPASITDSLGTVNQSKFILTAYKVFKNEYSSNMGELRLLLIKGIEVIRCVGNHGLDVKLLVALANIFSELSKKCSKISEIEANDCYAELYWKTALPLLENIKNNRAVTYSRTRLFEYKNNKDMSLNEINTYIEKGKLFTGQQYMKKKEYEKALNIFEHLKDPYASFYQSQIYKLMADQKTNLNKENLTSEMRSQNIILLFKSRDCLYLTLDRLREPSADRNHPLNTTLGTEIEKIERLLSRIDPDCNNTRNECEGMSESGSSGNNSTGEHYLTTYTTHTSFNKNDNLNHHQSTPIRFNINRQEARPSPERLDAQLRQLLASRDASINNISEQNKIMLESHKSLLDELRGFREAVNNLTSTVNDLKSMKSGLEEIKSVKKSVDDLRNSVDEVHNVVDIVHELKKEIHDLKLKDKDKNTQLSEEDLSYVLDNDCGLPLEYNINSNLANPIGYNPSQIYPHFQPQPRLPIPTSLAAAYGGLYPALYPGLPYPYGLGLPQGPIPFLPPDQQMPPISTNITPQMAFHHPTLPTTLIGQNLLQTPSISKESPKITVGNVTSTTQSIFSPVTTSQAATNKSLPVNVVITSSDPLPTTKTTTNQPILSVNIPIQHIKNSNVNTTKSQAHNYQITMPSANLVTSPSVLSQPAPVVVTTSLLSNVAPPIFSSVSTNNTPVRNLSLGQQIEKSLDDTFNNSNKNETIGNISNVSSASVEDHDAMPDFKPIIPLPDEVPVNTGEENEIELFCERAKLYRHVNKEWKERGVGNVKILHNPQNNKVRLLMRRDQVHKICANHFLTPDININMMPNNDRAYIWAVHDYADEETKLEKFCIKFKTSEEAKRFYDVFEESKRKVQQKNNDNKEKTNDKVVTTSTANLLGGFVFSAAPEFKPKEVEVKNIVEVPKEPQSSTPFANISFGTPKTNQNAFSALQNSFTTFSPVVLSQNVDKSPQKTLEDSEHVEEFVPTAEFKPVVPLPELVEIKTGEENAEVLFEERAKLFRYDTSGDVKEWKERGIGVIKILKEDNIVRLVMRREQVHKVCCNHQLLKETKFKINSSNPKSVLWPAQDYSEGILKPETFTIRFKNEELASQFLKTIQTAQTSLDENNQISKKHHKADPIQSQSTSPKTGFGDKFKPAKGSWECKNCYIVNDGKVSKCAACDTPKSGKTTEKTEQTFSFGLKSDGSKPSFDWGSAFKPAENTYECDVCLVRNSLERKNCISCDSPRDKSTISASKGVDLSTNGQKFTFGISTDQNKSVQGFGDAFKPKVNSWECKTCYIRNDGDKIHCVSCETPKDDSILPKKEASKGINLETPGLKFNFGIPTQAGGDASKSFAFTKVESPKISSNTPTIQENKEIDSKFVFGSPQKHEFEFKPRSPRKISTGQEESDNSYYVEEEEDNIYFKPVIPLPDKVEVRTGEEEEDVLYCHRAKLFRLCDGEWKERGLGDVKILKQKSSDKLRVVMRREQVLKICLNHWLTKDIKYVEKDEKSFVFNAPDFSEGDLANDTFCLRFKNGEIAKEFKNAIDNAIGNKTETATKDDNEVIFVSETNVTPEEEKEAKRLGLPPKFFAYRQLPDCTCEQCKKDDEYLKELFHDVKKTDKIGFSTPSSSASVSTPFFTPSAQNFTFTVKKDTPTDLSKSGSTPLFNFKRNESTESSSLKGLLQTPSNANIFNFKPATTLVTGSTTSTSNIFSSSTNTTPSNLFGNSTILSNSTPQSASNFATSKTSLFNDNSSNIFTNSQNNSSTGSIFGSTNTNSTSNLFGNSSNNVFSPSTTNSSIFGSTTTLKTSGSIFGGTTPTTNIFGSTTSTSTTTNSSTTTNTNIFGTNTNKNIFGTGTNIFSAPPTTGSIFSSTNTPVFGSGTPIFGAKVQNKPTEATLTFGNVSKEPLTTKLKETDEVVLKSEPGLTFSALAAGASPDSKPQFNVNKKEDVWKGLGAGAPVFGASRKAEKKDNDKDDDSYDNEGYDPHFEPIVPLPDEIQVSTGEEEETVLFNERAKVYRYDVENKEWKERGVGQLKILFHPKFETYRLLLRREQVHKVVLNQLISSDLEVQPMSTSDKAWMWAAHNFIEDEYKLEKLAARFKNTELAAKFKQSIDSAICRTIEIKNRKAAEVPVEEIPTSVVNYSFDRNVTEPTVQIEEVHENVEEEDDDDYEDEEEEEEDDEDDKSLMFEKNCQLSEKLASGIYKPVTSGLLQVYYDPSCYAARICMYDDNRELQSNTLIGLNTIMDINKNECTWRGVEWASDVERWRDLKATFECDVDAQEFHSNYLEGINFAQEIGILDELPVEENLD